MGKVKNNPFSQTGWQYKKYEIFILLGTVLANLSSVISTKFPAIPRFSAETVFFLEGCQVMIWKSWQWQSY